MLHGMYFNLAFRITLMQPTCFSNTPTICSKLKYNGLVNGDFNTIFVMFVIIYSLNELSILKFILESIITVSNYDGSVLDRCYIFYNIDNIIRTIPWMMLIDAVSSYHVSSSTMCDIY